MLKKKDVHFLSIYQNSPRGVCVGNGPAAVIVTGQNAVGSGHCRKIHHDIAALTASDHIFPMGNGQLCIIGKAKPPPNLRLTAEADQGQNTPKQQKCRQSRRSIAQYANINIVKSRIHTHYAIPP